MMEKITITQSTDTTFHVQVESRKTTEHLVTITQDYYYKLTDGKMSPETLLEESFKFLLERESNTSILSSFDLPVISRYFPDYEDAIKALL